MVCRMISATMVTQRKAMYRILGTRRSTTRSRPSIRMGIDNGGLPLRLIKSIIMEEDVENYLTNLMRLVILRRSGLRNG